MYISSVFNMYINRRKFIYNKARTTKLKINGNNVQFTVDMGSTINIINETTFKQLQNVNLKKRTYEHTYSIQVNPFKWQENLTHFLSRGNASW